MDRLLVFPFPALFQFIRFRAGKVQNIVNSLHANSLPGDSLHGDSLHGDSLYGPCHKKTAALTLMSSTAASWRKLFMADFG